VLAAPPEEDLSAPRSVSSDLEALAHVAATSVPVAQILAAEANLSDDPEILGEFLLESRDHLSNVESGMLTLERDPANDEAIHSVFRAFHTIKGLAGFLEFDGIRTLTHEVETLLDEVRNSRLRINPEITDVVLQSADRLNMYLRVLDAGLRNRSAPELAADPALMAKIRALLKPSKDESEASSKPEETVTAEDQEAPPAKTGNLAAETRTIKVDMAKLDYLVEMVGETVIASSLVRHNPILRATTNPRLEDHLAQLSRLLVEVQQTTMSLRMVPIDALFRKTARIARDLSRRAGKPLDLVIRGEETELDRNIVEELADPLMHMVRNSIDHGVEEPEDRAQAGKPAIARLELRAGHQAGHVVVEIADDGRGLDVTKIRRRAEERGLVDPGSSLSDEQVYNLIFLPGFSTADQVSDISGRGVGMDVVRKHIQKLRGRIEIHSQPGQGTRFSIKLPLTLAIIDGLVVRVASERYIIPTTSVRSMLRPGKDILFTLHERDEMALIRGGLLPVVRLHERFGIEGACTNCSEGLLIVAETDESSYCLLVDELIGRQEVVIKSLGDTFRNTPGVSGGAILGDGRISLILDMDGLSRRVDTSYAN